MLPGSTCGPERVVHLDNVAVLSKKIKLELLLESEKRDKMVKAVYLFAAEDKLMVFEKILSVLIYIHLERRIERMIGEGIVI